MLQRAIQVLSDNDPGLSYLYESMANNYMGVTASIRNHQALSRVLELDPKFERRDEIHAKMLTATANWPITRWPTRPMKKFWS